MSHSRLGTILYVLEGISVEENGEIKVRKTG